MDYLGFMNTSTEKKKTIDLFGKGQGLLDDSPKPNNLLPANPPVDSQVPAATTNDTPVAPAQANSLFGSVGSIAGSVLGGPIGSMVGGLAGDLVGGLFTDDSAIKEQQMQQDAKAQANLEQAKYEKMRKNLPQPQFLQGV